ncbi:MAG TPA: MerR family transcriptional regulator [Hyphomonadaceae bacterium]|jgi:DNA-binding transcriptional MerR regulator|nr:MerR family transcriptional regulator [Hyphomonadaceae bacterium]
MHIVNSSLVSIGPAEAARRMRITIKTLRHYERRGLLEPRRTSKGWRVYERADLARLEQVLAFKAMGFGLAQIASLLDASSDVVASALATQELNLEGQMKQLNGALDAVRIARAKPARPASGLPVALAA